MVKIRNESDFKNWFKKNYKKLGFSKIVRYDQQRFPDFVMLRDGKEVRVELEIKSSNFILHKHPIGEVDEIICIKKDVELKMPITELRNFELISPLSNSKYSIPSQIYELFKNERILTSSEVAKKLKPGWNTAERGLLELKFQGRVESVKKEGVNLWLLK